MDEGRDKALQRCEESIRRFERLRKRAWSGFVVFQSGAVVLSALTPILILVGGVPKWVQALPAALGAVSAGLVEAFGFRENKTRWAVAEERLRSERVKFLTDDNYGHPQPKEGSQERVRSDEEIALGAFVNSIEGITVTAMEEWRREHLARAKDEDGPKT